MKSDEEEIKRLSMRIKSARALTGLSQTEFCQKYSLSIGAYKTWESGKFAPRNSNLIELCRCLEQEGIFNATTEWFLKGIGPSPTHISSDINTKSEFKEYEEDILKEIALFKKNQSKKNQHAIIANISDDLMAPYFLNGDIIGGIKIDIMPSILELERRPFLVETRPDQYIVRWCFSDGKIGRAHV